MSAPILATVLSLKKNGAVKSTHTGFYSGTRTGSGGATGTMDASFVNITIPPVDTNKTVISVHGGYAAGTNDTGLKAISGSSSIKVYELMPRMVNSTTLRVSVLDSTNNVFSFRWHIVEFN